MDERHLPLLLLPSLGPLLLAGQAPLLPGELPLAFGKRLGVCDLHAIAPGHEVVHAGVDAEHRDGARRCLGFRAVRAAQAHEVSARGHLLHRCREHAALDPPAHPRLHEAELGELHMAWVWDACHVCAVRPAACMLGPELREPRPAWIAEEVLVCPVQVAQGLLQRHGVHLRKEGRVCLLPNRQLRHVRADAPGLSVPPIFFLAHGKDPVVDISAAAEGSPDELSLPRVRIDAYLIGALHSRPPPALSRNPCPCRLQVLACGVSVPSGWIMPRPAVRVPSCCRCASYPHS